jgi:hypothetical protein
MATVVRIDRGESRGAVERTPEGFVRVPAALTRVGVLEYKDSAGKVWREYRSP